MNVLAAERDKKDHMANSFEKSRVVIEDPKRISARCEELVRENSRLRSELDSLRKAKVEALGHKKLVIELKQEI